MSTYKEVDVFHSMMTIDLPHVPGAKEVAESDAQESSAEESLIQKFLKASHNLVNIVHLTFLFIENFKMSHKGNRFYSKARLVEF